MVITYRVPRLTYRLMMRKALLPYVGLPNILAGEFIVPELLQDQATPENLEQALGNWLAHKGARERLESRFAAIHESLAVGNDERVVKALAPYLHAGAFHDPQAHGAAEPAALRSR
jgi:lipid-A-disaccharide synthase